MAAAPCYSGGPRPGAVADLVRGGPRQRAACGVRRGHAGSGPEHTRGRGRGFQYRGGRGAACPVASRAKQGHADSGAGVRHEGCAVIEAHASAPGARDFQAAAARTGQAGALARGHGRCALRGGACTRRPQQPGAALWHSVCRFHGGAATRHRAGVACTWLCSQCQGFGEDYAAALRAWPSGSDREQAAPKISAQAAEGGKEQSPLAGHGWDCGSLRVVFEQTVCACALGRAARA